MSLHICCSSGSNFLAHTLWGAMGMFFEGLVQMGLESTYLASDSHTNVSQIRANRFARIDLRESIRNKKLFLKHLVRFARIVSSLRFALKFAWFASSPRCYPFSGRSIRNKTVFSKRESIRANPPTKVGENAPLFYSFFFDFLCFLRFSSVFFADDCY